MCPGTGCWGVEKYSHLIRLRLIRSRYSVETRTMMMTETTFVLMYKNRTRPAAGLKIMELPAFVLDTLIMRMVAPFHHALHRREAP